MSIYIRQTGKPANYLNVEIDPGGMSVVWTGKQHATPFPDQANADSMIARLAERYPDEKVYCSGD